MTLNVLFCAITLSVFSQWQSDRKQQQVLQEGYSVQNILNIDYLLTIASGLLNHFKMSTVHKCV